MLKISIPKYLVEIFLLYYSLIDMQNTQSDRIMYIQMMT